MIGQILTKNVVDMISLKLIDAVTQKANWISDFLLDYDRPSSIESVPDKKIRNMKNRNGPEKLSISSEGMEENNIVSFK